MSKRQNVPSDFGTGGAGLTPEGSGVQQPTPATFGPGAIPVNPDLATIIWALLGRIAPVAANYTALAAFGATNALDRQDGQVVLVDSDNSVWKWDALDNRPAGPNVVLALDAPSIGRWQSVSAQVPATPTVAIDLKGAVLAAGTVLGAYAGAAPGITLDNAKAVGVRWKGGTLTSIWTEVDLPLDLDPTFPVTAVFNVVKSGATATDVASITVAAYAQTVGALEDADTNRGAISTALTTAQASAAAGTITKLQAAIYLPPTVPARLTISVTPSGTLVTDDLIILGSWLEYTKRPAVPCMLLDMRAAILATGVPMAAFANNAGASAPGITLDNAKAVGVRWNNQATLTAVWCNGEMPADFDVTKPAVAVVLASKSGATGGDATTFDLAMYQQAPGSLEDVGGTGFSFTGTTSALTGAATAKTVAKLTVGIPANTFAAAPAHLSVSIKPTDGTLGTDDGIVNGFWIEYQRKATAIPNVQLKLDAAILAAGTPMAAFANNAGASAPGVTLNNSKAVGVRWNNFATQTAIWTERDLPLDFDPTQPCTLVALVSKSGATLADASSLTVTMFEQAVGTTETGGPTFSGATSALTAAQAVLAAKTVSKLTMVIPANTFSSPGRLSVSVKPTDGTLTTDDLLLCGFWLEYSSRAA